ncbi:MAG TPA: hypothetical protein VLH56_09465 [Dissulfurispiraceae bacterium]|nr:hypothetical protein [Dissulfurispiraceae bacterium]
MRRVYSAVCITITILFFMLSLTLPVFAADVRPAQQPALQVSKQPDIQAVKPKRPAKVKLHRNVKGEYTWDITADSADEVVRTDARLRKLLKIE